MSQMPSIFGHFAEFQVESKSKEDKASLSMWHAKYEKFQRAFIPEILCKSMSGYGNVSSVFLICNNHAMKVRLLQNMTELLDFN